MMIVAELCSLQEGVELCANGNRQRVCIGCFVVRHHKIKARWIGMHPTLPSSTVYTVSFIGMHIVARESKRVGQIFSFGIFGQPSVAVSDCCLLVSMVEHKRMLG